MEGVIGYTTLFAGNFAPKNWAFAQGQVVNIASNTALFSILGTTYGGNGTTTFGLPDLRGRAVVGTGQGPGLSQYSLGQVGGSETTTLNSMTMPVHTHMVSVVGTLASASSASSSDPTNSTWGPDSLGNQNYSTSPNTTLKPAPATLTMAPNGSSTPFSIQSPFMALNYIICMFGVYPARN
jgi:microcystin-dependent protein